MMQGKVCLADRDPHDEQEMPRVLAAALQSWADVIHSNNYQIGSRSEERHSAQLFFKKLSLPVLLLPSKQLKSEYY